MGPVAESAGNIGSDNPRFYSHQRIEVAEELGICLAGLPSLSLESPAHRAGLKVAARAFTGTGTDGSDSPPRAPGATSSACEAENREFSNPVRAQHQSDVKQYGAEKMDSWHTRVVERGASVGQAPAHNPRGSSSERSLPEWLLFGRAWEEKGAAVLGGRSCWNPVIERDTPAWKSWFRKALPRSVSMQLQYSTHSSLRARPKFLATLPLLLCVLLAFTVVEAVVAALAGEFWDPSHSHDCSGGGTLRHRMTCLLSTLGHVKCGATYLILFCICSVKILSVRLGEHACRWSVAASRDVFNERASGKLGLCMITMTVAMFVSFDLGVRFYGLYHAHAHRHQHHSGNDHTYMLVGQVTRQLLRGGSYTIATWLVTAPAYLWSPLVETALRLQKQSRRQHVPRIVRLSCVPLLYTAVSVGFSVAMHDHGRLEVEIVSAVVAAYQIGLLIYVLDLQTWKEFLRVLLPCFVFAIDNVIKKLLGHLDDLRPGVSKSPHSHCSAETGDQGGSKRDVHRQPSLEETEMWNTGSAFKRKCIAIVLIYGLSLPLYVHASELVPFIVLMTLRFFLIAWLGMLYFGFSEDHPTDWSMLNDDYPGFGLVINASDLRRALIAELAGKDYTGPMRTYKASMLRMEETMAISYRWQAESRSFAQGRLELNMSCWQITALAKAMKEWRCLYVWIDKVSVIQEPCRLQQTLLSRMMAVYAAAYITVALRSAEQEHERYHQRIWTLQEWCCSRQLVAYTEQTDTCNDKFAFLPEEHTFLEKLRAQQTAKYKHCRPYWLLSLEERAMDPGFALKIAKQYDDLAKHMTCKIETDKIRALIPMLCNIPVETQDELEMLVQMIVVHAPQYSRILAGLHGAGRHRSKRSSSDHSSVIGFGLGQLTSLRPVDIHGNVSQIFYVPPAALDPPIERDENVNADAHFLLPIANFQGRVHSMPRLPNSLHVKPTT